MEHPHVDRHAHGRDRDRDREAAPGAADEAAPGLDPIERALGQAGLLRPAAPPAPPASGAAAAAPPALPPVDQLAERLLRRMAIGGSRHRGTALLEVGAGPLQGASIVVTSSPGELRIQIEGEGEAARAWGQQLERRLRERGVEAEVIVTGR